MNKKDADEVKAEYNKEHAYELALEFLSREELEYQLATLDLVECVLEEEFPEYSLDTKHDLIDHEENVMVRVLWFSKGLKDYFLCVNGEAAIVGYDGDIPPDLLGGAIKSISNAVSE